MSSSLFGFTLAAAVCLLAGEAAADSLASTRTSGIREHKSQIALTFAHDHVELVVQRSVFNSADISDQATWLIDVPEGAVAIALRTRSVGTHSPRWLDIETTQAEIVRVDASAQHGVHDALIESCLTEAAWALPLPIDFHEDWEQFHIEL